MEREDIEDPGMAGEPAAVHRFGPYVLEPARRLLLRDGVAVRLGARALDLLIALVRQAGTVLSNERLLAAVWGGLVVEESNLRVHMAALRKLLGEAPGGGRYVVNVPLQGYCFVADVQGGRVAPAAAAPPVSAPGGDVAPDPSPHPPAAPRGSGLPARLASVYGRDTEIDALVDALPKARFVTIVGPGGAGKTTLALAVAERLAAGEGGAATFVDLAAVDAPDRVVHAVAAALGLVVGGTDPLPAVLGALRQRPGLLLLDNCEHVVDSAAQFAEAVHLQTPATLLLATSREPLRAQGESVRRLGPLALPPPGAALDRSSWRDYAALRLFVDRMEAAGAPAPESPQELATVATICRRLDGMPLALELAAAWVDSYGLAGVASRLEEFLSLRAGGRRTAPARHRTLRAALDWSYGALPPPEQALLQRLGVFAAAFTVDDAEAVAASGQPGQILQALSSLVLKSLVVADIGGEVVRYRLLETTRAFAVEQLHEAGHEPAARAARAAHAAHALRTMRQARAEWQAAGIDKTAWTARYAPQVADVRAALEWLLGPGDDAGRAALLAADAALLWFRLGQSGDYSGLAERTLARWSPAAAAVATTATTATAATAATAVAMTAGTTGTTAVATTTAPEATAAEPPEAVEMRLVAALGQALVHAAGPGSPRLVETCGRALALAERLGDRVCERQMLFRLWNACVVNGDYAAALPWAERHAAASVDSPDPQDALVTDRMFLLSLHTLGEHERARQHGARILSHPEVVARRLTAREFEIDHRVMALAFSARANWILGESDLAWRQAREAVDEALAGGHVLGQMYALGVSGCLIAMWIGDLAQADAWVGLMAERAANQSLAIWSLWARCFDTALRLRGHEPAPRPPAPAADLLPYNTMQQEVLATLAEGPVSAALLERIDLGRGRYSWCAPEVLRVRALTLLAEGGAAQREEAMGLLERSAAIAEAQGARGWLVRTVGTRAASVDD